MAVSSDSLILKSDSLGGLLALRNLLGCLISSKSSSSDPSSLAFEFAVLPNSKLLLSLDAGAMAGNQLSAGCQILTKLYLDNDISKKIINGDNIIPAITQPKIENEFQTNFYKFEIRIHDELTTSVCPIWIMIIIQFDLNIGIYC